MAKLYFFKGKILIFMETVSLINLLLNEGDELNENIKKNIGFPRGCMLSAVLIIFMFLQPNRTEMRTCINSHSSVL